MALVSSFLPQKWSRQSLHDQDKTTSPFLPRYMSTYQLFPRFTHGCYGGKILDIMFGAHSLSSTRFSFAMRNSMIQLTGLDYKYSEKLNHFNHIG